MAVLRRQGLWAWMTIIGAEELRRIGHSEFPGASSTLIPLSLPLLPPASVRGELLAAWTDLLVGVIAQKEAKA